MDLTRNNLLNLKWSITVHGTIRYRTDTNVHNMCIICIFLVLTTISHLLSWIPKSSVIVKNWGKMNLSLRLIIVFHIRWLPISHSSSAGGFFCFSVSVTKFYTTQILLRRHTNLSTSIQITWTHIFASRNSSHVVQADSPQNKIK